MQMQRIIQNSVAWASRLLERGHPTCSFMRARRPRYFCQREPREAGGRGAWACASRRGSTGSGAERDEAGISLLEVLMAIALLGISFASIFSGLSTALRATDRLDRIERGTDYAELKLNELELDPTLGPGQIRSGVSPSGISWQAATKLVDSRPLSDPDRPQQLVRITLEVSWRTRLGQQSLSLETLRLYVAEPPPNP